MVKKEARIWPVLAGPKTNAQKSFRKALKTLLKRGGGRNYQIKLGKGPHHSTKSLNIKGL